LNNVEKCKKDTNSGKSMQGVSDTCYFLPGNGSVDVSIFVSVHLQIAVNRE
jgi:hypothetical protein